MSNDYYYIRDTGQDVIILNHYLFFLMQNRFIKGWYFMGYFQCLLSFLKTYLNREKKPWPWNYNFFCETLHIFDIWLSESNKCEKIFQQSDKPELRIFINLFVFIYFFLTADLEQTFYCDKLGLSHLTTINWHSVKLIPKNSAFNLNGQSGQKLPKVKKPTKGHTGPK